MNLLENRENTIGLRKMSLEQYIHLLDRLLEKKFAPNERDAIFNDEDNIELVSKAYEKGIHPLKIVKKLSADPVDMMYASTNENVIFESTEELTPGQIDAIRFLEPIGLELVSTPRQIKRGTLIFKDTNSKKDIYWGIFKTGYIRKLNISNKPTYTEPRWQVVDKIAPIDDDEYLEIAQMLSQKIRSHKKRTSYRKTYVDRVFKYLNYHVEMLANPSHLTQFRPTEEEIELAIERIYKKYLN